MEYSIHNMDQLSEFAESFVHSLEHSREHATIIGLSGDLGSGKTAFTKALARALDIDEEVLSPTFVIAKYYPLKSADWVQLVHVDAYRIEGEKELNPLKWDEMVGDASNLIVVEWPELLGKRYPDFASTLKFTFVDEKTRTITTQQ